MKGDKKEIVYNIDEDFGKYIIEETGNTYIALQKISWNGGEYKFDLRKWLVKDDGDQAYKGVTLTNDGMNELTSTLISKGFGETDAILIAIKDRDDFSKAYDKVINGIDDESTGVVYDPREVFKEEE